MRLLIVVSLLIPTFASADNCGTLIKSMKVLETRLLALQEPRDADLGARLQSDAQEYILKFNQLAKDDQCREKVFKAYVDLAQAVAPFDGESQGAASIASVIAQDDKLNTVYKTATREFVAAHKGVLGLTCRTKLLEDYVRENLCRKTHTKACKPATENYEACAGLPQE